MPDHALTNLSDNLFWVTLIAYSVAMVLFFAHLAYRGRVVGTIATAIAGGGALVHATSIALRGLATGRVPWGNMYEYSMMIGLLVVLVYLFVLDRRLGLRAMGGFLMGAGVLALVTARFVYVPAGPLQPALSSMWLKFHVIAAITGSTLFGVSFIFTVLYLLKDRAERRAGTVFAGSTVGAAYVGQETIERDPGLPVDLASEEPSAAPRRAGGRILGRLPSASELDNYTLRTISFAFPIWTFAVLAGAIWAHEAWGRYWGWDPKETFAFVTWVIYAGYLHARSTSGWRGRRSAIISCVGFVSVTFTYWAVNLWIKGLHSYAK